MEDEWVFVESIEECIDDARKEGLSWEQISHGLIAKAIDIKVVNHLGLNYLVTHMD